MERDREIEGDNRDRDRYREIEGDREIKRGKREIKRGNRSIQKSYHKISEPSYVAICILMCRPHLQNQQE